MWVGIPLQDTAYNYLACDVKIKLRVVSPYRRKVRDYSIINDTLGPNKGLPMYSFSTDGLVSAEKINSKINAESSVVIYPNPSNGKFTISINNSVKENARYNIYSFEGRVIKSDKINKSQQNFEISEKGIYIIKISNGDKVWSQKVVVL